VIAQLVSTGDATSSIKAGKLKTGVSTLPNFRKDATDRNRTSPFAFTGNKFEFRMPGSSDSVGSPNIVLNTIVAEAFCEIADELEQAPDFEDAIHDIIKRLATKHQRIVFDGNGYSDEWVAEAEERGLPNLKTMVDAIPALVADQTVELFEKFGVFTRAELESRAEVQYEAFAKAINIEARAMIDIAGKQIIPAVIKGTTQLATSIQAVRSVAEDMDVSVQLELLTEMSALLADTKVALSKLQEVTKIAGEHALGKDQAEYFNTVVRPAMRELRTPIDELEMLVDKDLWPMPSYGDLIFEV
jgi:glutamine synthetase